MRIHKELKAYWDVAGEFSPGLLGRFGLFLRLLSIPLRKKVFGRKPIRVEMRRGAKEFPFYLRDAADIAVLREMFVDGEYDASLAAAPKRIVDIGAHIGASVLYLRLKYPDAAITAYEPDPDNFSVLCMNVAAFPGIRTVNAAVAKESGVAAFHLHKGSSISASLVEREGGKVSIPVRTVGIGEALSGAEGTVDLVKFDIEGAEFNIFPGYGKLASVGAYVGELHPDLAPGKSREGFLAAFEGFEVREKASGKDRSIIHALRR